MYPNSFYYECIMNHFMDRTSFVIFSMKLIDYQTPVLDIINR